jgi:hypothetical protein
MDTRLGTLVCDKMPSVDNFEYIKSLLSFESEDDLYMIQILQRRKDQEKPETMKNGVNIKDTYYIYSITDFDNIRQKVIDTAQKYNARAYVNLNKRSARKVALQTLKLIADYIQNEDYKAVRHAYSTACGSSGTTGSKKWVLDLDSKDPKDLDTIIDFLKKNEIIHYGTVNTPNGYHIISGPFNPRLTEIFDNGLFSIHKNNPTVLWAPETKFPMIIPNDNQ